MKCECMDASEEIATQALDSLFMLRRSRIDANQETCLTAIIKYDQIMGWTTNHRAIILDCRGEKPTGRCLGVGRKTRGGVMMFDIVIAREANEVKKAFNHTR